MDDVAIIALVKALRDEGVDSQAATAIVCEAIKSRPYTPPPIVPEQSDRVSLLEFALESSTGPSGWLDWQRLTDDFTKMPETRGRHNWAESKTTWTAS